MVNMYFIKKIVLNILLFTLVQSNATELCDTTYDEPPECRSIQKCPTLFEMIKHNTTSSVEFIRKSICLFQIDYKVCCISLLNSAKPIDTNEQKTNNNRQLLASRKYCGYQHSDDYDHNSNGTVITEFPWLARIIFGYPIETQNSYGKQYPCLGSLINTRYILTSASCVVDTMIPIEVQLGEYHIANDTDCVTDDLRNIEECSDPTRFYEIVKIITHLNFNRSSKANDIALIRLNKVVKYSEYVRPICLPYPGTKFANIGNTLTTSGWGSLYTERDNAVIKKKVLGALISIAECKEAYKNVSKATLTEKQICTVTYDNSTELCMGDSGAPVIFSYKLQWHQEGIVSAGVGVCGSEFPEVHTKVQEYLDWIEQNIEP